jgi:hypothetical protein
MVHVTHTVNYYNIHIHVKPFRWMLIRGRMTIFPLLDLFSSTSSLQYTCNETTRKSSFNRRHDAIVRRFKRRPKEVSVMGTVHVIIRAILNSERCDESIITAYRSSIYRIHDEMTIVF